MGKKKLSLRNVFMVGAVALILLSYTASGNDQFQKNPQDLKNSKPQKNNPEGNSFQGQKNPPRNNRGQKYSTQQAISDKAQLSTISFSGLAFITGNSGADTFIPPGKVADFFGFQYMRDVDKAGYGHNSTFLNKAAGNIFHILNTNQREKLINLAKEQAPLFVDFAYNRLSLINAFRRELEGKIPAGSKGLDIERAAEYTGNLYKIDAELSYKRAVVMGEIINSFTKEQKEYLANLKFDDSSTWADIRVDRELKQELGQREFVAAMTYASELFSWYKGNLEADTYFCPERHGTYFGGFYLKDLPAMNNPGYFISTEITGDKGQAFLNILNREQRAKMENIIILQKNDMSEIVKIREDVSKELRKSMSGGKIDREKVFSLIEKYGELDGRISGIYADAFGYINRTLSDEQRKKMMDLRELHTVPEGSYLYSNEVKTPELPNNDYLFGIGVMPKEAGVLKAPKNYEAIRGKK